MTTEEIAIAVRREQRYLWGGHGSIVAIVLISALMLALGIQWYWTLIMIPVSAEGALMMVEARTSKHARTHNHRLDAVNDRLDALDSGQAAIWQGQAWLAEKIELASSATREEHRQIRGSQQTILDSAKEFGRKIDELWERHADLERDVAQMAMWRRDVQKQTEGKLRIVPPPRDLGEPR